MAAIGRAGGQARGRNRAAQLASQPAQPGQPLKILSSAAE